MIHLYTTGEQRSIPLDLAIKTLSAYWPYLFPYGILRPVVKDIETALYQDKQHNQFHISEKRLKQSLAVILHSTAYQATLIPGAVRYDHHGEPKAVVMENDCVVSPYKFSDI